MPRLRFGPFELDDATGELRKHGSKLKLGAQPLQLLRLLLATPGEVVTREELRTRLWGNDTFVDFDHSLNAAVNKLRQALNDSAAQPRWIETLAGKGYRFIGAIEGEAATPPTAGVLARPEELPEAPHRLVQMLLLLIQATYLGFYLSALANLHEIWDLFTEWGEVPAGWGVGVLIATACMLIPVRLFLASAVLFRPPNLGQKFRTLFPALLCGDLLWALSPFLLLHHVSMGLALGIAAALVYLPFAQRSLFWMLQKH